MNNETWETMMRQFLSGDRSAQIRLLTTLKAPLFGFLYRLTRNPVIAEDLLQETLVTLCTRGETWNPDRPLKPWVFTIARNKFLEFKRRERKIVPFHRPEELAQQQTFAPPSETPHVVREALAQLSEPIREAFLLKHFADLTFVEVAEVQEVPVATAKSRVLFAVRKLRELLGDDHDN